jgi:O-antigen/teichoic acid export membrane protein
LRPKLPALNLQVDVLVVGYFATPAVAGSLKVARTFTLPFTMLQHPFYEAIYPTLVRDVAERRFAEMEALLRRASAAIALIIVPAALAMMALAPFAIPLLFGAGFGQAPLAVVPLAAAGLLAALLFWLDPAALALDMQVLSLRMLAIATGAQFAMLLLLTPALEAPGAGLSYLGFVVLWTALLLPPVAHRVAPSGTLARRST